MNKQRKELAIWVWRLTAAFLVGCLIWLLRPVVATAFLKTGRHGGENAQQVVKSIIACNLEREMTEQQMVWPSSNSADYAHTSTAYFKYQLAQRRLEGIDSSFFAGGGVPPQSVGLPLRAANNAWKIVAGFRGDEPDTMPFMFTRNAGITTEDVRCWPQSRKRIPLDEDAVPYGDEKAIVVSKGAAMQVLSAKKFRWNAFWQTTNRYDYLEVWDVE